MIPTPFETAHQRHRCRKIHLQITIIPVGGPAETYQSLFGFDRLESIGIRSEIHFLRMFRNETVPVKLTNYCMTDIATTRFRIGGRH